MVPTLRFPEFSGEWEKTKLSEVCHIATGNKNTQDKDDNGQYPFYVRSQHIEHINSWTYDGEAILTAGDGVGVGKVFHYSKGKIGVHQRVYILNDFKCDGKFLFYYFSGHFYDRVKRMSAKNSVDSVRMEMIANMNFIYPRRGEQTKIGHLFSLLDERIETQIRIIDKLKSLMQGLNNELMDNPKWEKVYVGDFMEFFPTNSLSWEQLNYDNGQVRNLHYGLIHSGLPTLVDCQKESLPYIQDSSLSKQYTDCRDGDVAFADASEDTEEVGKVVELTNIKTQTIACGLHTIHGRDVKNITVEGFKGFAFNSKYFHNQLRRIAQGSKVYSINTDNVKSCYIYIPTIDEQQKIVGLLCCMQEKMGIAEEELRQYTIQKQFLLKGLFV